VFHVESSLDILYVSLDSSEPQAIHVVMYIENNLANKCWYVNTTVATRCHATILRIAFIELRTNIIKKKTYFYKIKRDEKCSGISHLPFYVYINVAIV